MKDSRSPWNKLFHVLVIALEICVTHRERANMHCHGKHFKKGLTLAEYQNPGG
jgi:hypothetical protein